MLHVETYIIKATMSFDSVTKLYQQNMIFVLDLALHWPSSYMV